MTIALLYHLQCGKARIQICGQSVDCHIFDDKTVARAQGGEVTDFGPPFGDSGASLIEGKGLVASEVARSIDRDHHCQIL